MNCLRIINRGLSRFGLALVRMKAIAEMNRVMEQLESDKLSLSDRLIEMDRMNATPRCDAPWRNHIKTLEKSLRSKRGKKAKK